MTAHAITHFLHEALKPSTALPNIIHVSVTEV